MWHDVRRCVCGERWACRLFFGSLFLLLLLLVGIFFFVDLFLFRSGTRQTGSGGGLSLRVYMCKGEAKRDGERVVK